MTENIRIALNILPGKDAGIEAEANYENADLFELVVVKTLIAVTIMQLCKS